MNIETLPSLYPAFIAVTYYALVIFLAEVSRKLVDLVTKKGSTLYIFLIELIAVSQQCTCVYENGVMIKHYGAVGFFCAVVGILVVTSRFNRGAFVSPFMPIEMFYRGSISTERFLTVLFAQSLGGYSAYRIANTLWYYTVNYSADHAHFYRDLPCSIQYKVGERLNTKNLLRFEVPFMYVIAYEVFGMLSE
ncbi:Aquaporin [Aphelenchoides besseyi]|nr:Aquaporin [Aphelenchoides besseyi]